MCSSRAPGEEQTLLQRLHDVFQFHGGLGSISCVVGGPLWHRFLDAEIQLSAASAKRTAAGSVGFFPDGYCFRNLSIRPGISSGFPVCGWSTEEEEEDGARKPAASSAAEDERT